MLDCLVVGSGFAGAVFARQLAEEGKKVLIIEKRGHIGGNAYEDYSDNGIRVHRYGPHIFHTANKRVFEYLSRFSNFYSYNHKVLGEIEQKLVPIPINFKSIEMLFDSEKAMEIKQKLEQLFGLDKNVSVFDLLNSNDEVVQQFGQFVFDNVFKNYTAKQWGQHPDKVDKSAINRVPVVVGYSDNYFSDEFQFMPKDGFTPLFEALLDHQNITVQLNTDAKDVVGFDFENKKILFNSEVFEGTLMLSCAIDYLLDFRFGVLPYRTVDLKFEDVKQEYFQQNSVVNYPNQHDYTRITEFKYLTAQVEKSCSTILREYPKAYDPNEKNEPYYPINNPENNALYDRYKEMFSEFSNIVLCGRLSQYSYFNMDKVVENALNLADDVVKTLK